MNLSNIQTNYPNCSELIFNVFNDVCKKNKEVRKLDSNFNFPSHVFDLSQLTEVENILSSDGNLLNERYGDDIFYKLIVGWLIDNFYEFTYSQETLI